MHIYCEMCNFIFCRPSGQGTFGGSFSGRSEQIGGVRGFWDSRGSLASLRLARSGYLQILRRFAGSSLRLGRNWESLRRGADKTPR